MAERMGHAACVARTGHAEQVSQVLPSLFHAYGAHERHAALKAISTHQQQNTTSFRKISHVHVVANSAYPLNLRVHTKRYQLTG